MEGGFDLGQRVKAWKEMYGSVDPKNVKLYIEQPFNLMTEETLDVLKQLGKFQPSVIFIDTQTLAAPGVDENSNSEMTSLLSTVKLISQMLGCLVVLVHHSGYSDKGRARGASSMYANMDVSMVVEGSAEAQGQRKLKMTKFKSGPLASPMHFTLQEAGQSVAVVMTEPPINELQADHPDLFEGITPVQRRV